jgi:replicative DNA helicase
MEENYDDVPVLDKLLIKKLEHEKMFAGCLFVDPQELRQSCEWLDPADITDNVIRACWQYVLDHDSPRAAHEWSIKTENLATFARYATRIPTSLDAEFYAVEITDAAYMIECLNQIGQMSRAVMDNDPERLKSIAQAVADKTPRKSEKIPTLAEVGIQFYQDIDNLGNVIETTGISSLDAAMGGLERDSLTIVAGRPGMGKSSLALQMAHANAKAERKVLLFELEMSERAVIARMACGRAHVAWRDVKSKRATKDQIAHVREMISEIIDDGASLVSIDTTPDLTCAAMMRKVKQEKPDVVIVDHLGLMDFAKRGSDNEVVRLGNVSRWGKIIAKKAHVPVVMLHQLNRAVEARESKVPTLADLRGSGEIEQDADNVLFLYRPDYYEGAKEDQTVKVVDMKIIIAKLRDGQSNVQVNLKYDLREQWFYPVAKL